MGYRGLGMMLACSESLISVAACICQFYFGLKEGVFESYTLKTLFNFNKIWLVNRLAFLQQRVQS